MSCTLGDPRDVDLRSSFSSFPVDLGKAHPRPAGKLDVLTPGLAAVTWSPWLLGSHSRSKGPTECLDLSNAKEEGTEKDPELCPAQYETAEDWHPGNLPWCSGLVATALLCHCGHCGRQVIPLGGTRHREQASYTQPLPFLLGASPAAGRLPCPDCLSGAQPASGRSWDSCCLQWGRPGKCQAARGHPGQVSTLGGGGRPPPRRDTKSPGQG